MMQHEKHEEYEFGRECHDLNLGLVTKVRGLQRCGSKVKSKSHISCSQECRKCEGKNPHTPKWAPTLGVGVPMDS